MTIVIYGAGGVGAFFGGLLARGGQDVHFVARGSQLDALRMQGLRIDSLLLGQVQIGPLQAHVRASGIGRAGLVLVCVKAHQTEAILDDLASVVDDDTVIVTMQNGVDSDELVAARFGRARVVPAVVYVGATLDAPGMVTHVAAGTIVIGARPGVDASRLPFVRAALAQSGQPVRIVDDIQRERWAKLIWNASFNTVSAVSMREPRDLLAAPEARALVIGIMREVVAVAQAHGIALRESDIDQQIGWTERATAVRTSMMVDRERGRAMETEALVGVIVRLGRAHGVPTPFSEALYGLLKAIEGAAPPPAAPQQWVPPPIG
jgi:2-dehydropantoate 2-reductase